MYLDFRPLLRRSFAELSRKYLYPAISRGRIEGKANTRGLGDWLSQSLSFGNLAVACGACFSRLQKASLGSDSGRMQQVQGCASGPWCLAVTKPHLWRARRLSKSTTTQGTEPEPNRNSLVPFSCRTPGGSGWQPFTKWLWLISNFRETFAKKSYSRELKKNFREGFQHNMHGFRN